jgi:hypothetical protein
VTPVVSALWRFPVKSMAGERLADVDVDGRGLVGDRAWAVYDEQGRLASGKHTRRFRRMDPVFALAARTVGERVEVVLPDGRVVVAGESAADLALSDHFGEEVELAVEAATPHQDAGQVSIVGTATLHALGALLGVGAVDERHLRANLVVETEVPFEEETWCGREVAVGRQVRLAVTERVERCRMVDVEQADVPALEGLLRAVGQHRGLCAAVYADVVVPGVVAVGDELRP